MLHIVYKKLHFAPRNMFKGLCTLVRNTFPEHTILDDLTPLD